MVPPIPFCEQCGKPLSPGVRFCENCGAAVQLGQGQPGLGPPGYPAVPRAAASRSKSSTDWILWLGGGAAVLALCCLLGVGAILLIPSARQLISSQGSNPAQTLTQDTPIAAASTATTSGISPTPTQPSPATVLPESPTATPVPTIPPPPAPTLPPTPRAEQVFTDDFSSLSTGWPQLNDSVRMVGYNEGAMYVIALKQPGSDGDILIPHSFDLPLSTVELYFRARPIEGKGYFGVDCNYIDENNYTFIGITEGAYTIAKNVNGEYTSFLDPFWVNDPFIASEDNEFQVLVKCGNGRIELMINGYSVPAVDYPDMLSGDVAISASSSKTAVLDDEFFYKVLFDDVELKAR